MTADCGRAATGWDRQDAGLGDICKIDPTACPTIDMEKAANRDMKVQMYAVQQIYALRNHRFEVNPYFGITMNDQFVGHPGPGIAVNWYITNVLAVNPALGISGEGATVTMIAEQQLKALDGGRTQLVELFECSKW